MWKKTALLTLTAALSTTVACAADTKSKPAEKKAEAELTTEQDKTLYTVGQLVSQNLKVFSLTEAELAVVKAGLTDGILNKPSKVDVQQYAQKAQELARARMTEMIAAEKKKGQEFAEKAATEPGAVKTASGLIYKEVTAGKGDSPKPTDKVKVHYTGTLIDGTVFDSSVKRGEPATFGLNGVVPCWTEGVGKMKVGGTAKLVCPSDLAYGDRGSPPTIKPGSTLVFEVELLEILKEETAAAKPAPAAAPATAPAPAPAPKKN